MTWSPPANDGGGPIASYTVTSAPGGKTCTATGAVSCIVKGLANGTAYSFTVVAHNSSGDGAASAASAPVTPVPSIPGATYFALAPTRLLNPTVIKNKVARTVQVTGVGGIPDGAIAVTGNLTVVNPATSGYVAVTSTATNAPKTSTLNFPAHDIRANAVTAPLGSGQAQLHLRRHDRLLGRDHLRRDRLLPARAPREPATSPWPRPACSTRP